MTHSWTYSWLQMNYHQSNSKGHCIYSQKKLHEILYYWLHQLKRDNLADLKCIHDDVVSFLRTGAIILQITNTYRCHSTHLDKRGKIAGTIECYTWWWVSLIKKIGTAIPQPKTWQLCRSQVHINEESWCHSTYSFWQRKNIARIIS